jgi:hypothetical protein
MNLIGRKRLESLPKKVECVFVYPQGIIRNAETPFSHALSHHFYWAVQKVQSRLSAERSYFLTRLIA